jgi:hypothetical protein
MKVYSDKFQFVEEWFTSQPLWFGTTALPMYGVKFVTEDDLHLFDDVSGKNYWRFAVEWSLSKISRYRNAASMNNMDCGRQHKVNQSITT